MDLRRRHARITSTFCRDFLIRAWHFYGGAVPFAFGRFVSAYGSHQIQAVTSVTEPVRPCPPSARDNAHEREYRFCTDRVKKGYDPAVNYSPRVQPDRLKL